MPKTNVILSRAKNLNNAQDQILHFVQDDKNYKGM